MHGFRLRNKQSFFIFARDESSGRIFFFSINCILCYLRFKEKCSITVNPSNSTF